MATKWYLCAVDNNEATNNYIVKVIGEYRVEAYMREGVICADRKRRNLFECPEGFENVKTAIAGIAPFSLELEAFMEEIEGVRQKFELWKKPVRKRARAAQFAQGRKRKKEVTA